MSPPWLRTTLDSGHQPLPASLPEERRHHIIAAMQAPPPEIATLLRRFSKYDTSRRVLARVYRFIDCTRQREASSLTVHHFTRADAVIARWVQAEAFSHDLAALQCGHLVNADSPLAPFNHVVDEMRGMRVGGRIRGAELPL